MFVIRKEQLEAMTTAREAAFVELMVQHLHDHFAADLAHLGISPEALPDLVRRGVSAARAYGVTGESDVRRYLEIMALLGPAFDDDRRFPWAGETLTSRDLDGTRKMDLLTEHLIFTRGGPS